MQILFEIFTLSILTGLLSYGSVYLVRQWATRRQILAIPNERSSHTRPTPSGGGLAITFLTLLSWFSYHWFQHTLTTAVLALIAGGLLIAVISWLDDLYTMPTLMRLGVHSSAALLALWGIGWWQEIHLPFLLPIHLGWLGPLLTFVWLVSLTNAYNFMDGIDGIAGGQAVVTSSGWVILGWLSHQPSVMVLGLFLAATSLGFLQHNWSPARIFMGDVGSAFLGFTFATLTILAAPAASSLILAGLLMLWPFIFDTAFTLIRRWRNGENVFVAHRSHLYQRLVIAGYTHRVVATLYIALAIIGSLLGIAWYTGVPNIGTAIVTSIPLLAGGLWLFVTTTEKAHNTAVPAAPTPRTLTRTTQRADGGTATTKPSLQH